MYVQFPDIPESLKMFVELKLGVFCYLHFTLEIIYNTDKRLEKNSKWTL